MLAQPRSEEFDTESSLSQNQQQDQLVFIDEEEEQDENQATIQITGNNLISSAASDQSETLSSIILPMQSYCWHLEIMDKSQHLFPSLQKTTIPLRAQTYSIGEMFHFLPGALRFLTMSYVPEKLIKKRETPFDFIMRRAVVDPRRKGPPIGGIGAGMFTLGMNGWFTRSHLIFNQTGGIYSDTVLPVNQFSLRVERNGEIESFVLNPICEFKDGTMDKDLMKKLKHNWMFINDERRRKNKMQFSQQAYSLFPKSWTVYQTSDEKFTVICERYSPVWAHNYQESSFPTCNFEWTIINNTDEEANVSLLFTIQSEEKFRKKNEQSIIARNETDSVKCLTIETTVTDSFSHKDTIQFCIGANTSLGSITFLDEFNGTNESHLHDLWQEFNNNGEFSTEFCENFAKRHDWTKSQSKHLSCHAICSKVQIPSNSSKQVCFNLNWNAPFVRFGPTMEFRYLRHYTQFCTDAISSITQHKDTACFEMCKRSLDSSKQWKDEISQWHQGVIDQVGKGHPTAVAALFNELYYIVDGGTLWTNGGELDENGNSQDSKDYFFYLEGHEYLMCNTYDVHFYASHAMIMNWPQIQLSIQRDIIRAVREENTQEVTFYLSNMKNRRKVKGSVPHDVGTPYERPWKLVNAYNFQDVNKWKDLNSQFILTIFRDFMITKNREFLEEAFPSIILALNYSLTNFDKDGDGLIENESFPDTTYDAWKVTGVSAYSGMLWIASLKAILEMAKELDDENTRQKVEPLIESALKTFESKLWDETNQYYHYDASTEPQHDSIMSDHLHGTFMLLLIGNYVKNSGRCEDSHYLIPFNMERVSKSLNKILENNFVKYQQITKLGGCVNGMRPTQEVDKTSLQSREMWTGTSYVVAALTILLGRREEGIDLMKSVFDKCWSSNSAFWFQTPEAVTETGEYRALGYCRPLSIWSCLSAMMNKKI